MGAGYRNSFADNIADDIFDEPTRFSSNVMVSPIKRRKKTRRVHKRTSKSRRKRKIARVKRVKHTSKKGRKYPYWLKKYWFKKKKSR